MPESDTIAAVSSPAGAAARGIVRLSGADSVRIAAAVLSHPARLFSTRNYFHFQSTMNLGLPLGSVPATVYVMRAPASYTREDIVEFHTFGSPAILQALLERLLCEGARAAEPGEFTKRAFLSGRIDLMQAEAVLSLVKSESAMQRRAALAQLSGRLSEGFEDVRSRIVSLMARAEANIDFSDQEIELISREALERELSQTIEELSAVLSSVAARTVFKEEVLVPIVGRPNVGKSSLFNALLLRERSMTSEVPGTTRDTLEEVLSIDGIQVRLVDTAGIVKGERGVTAQAVDRSLAALEAAELLLFVVDASSPLTEEDRELASRFQAPAVVVANKVDLGKAAEADLPALVPSAALVFVSALKRTGLDELARGIAAAVRSGMVSRSTSRFALTAEQHNLLRGVVARLHDAQQASEQGLSEEFAALHLREAASELDRVTGRSVVESVLDEIFSRFCIGK